MAISEDATTGLATGDSAQAGAGGGFHLRPAAPAEYDRVGRLTFLGFGHGLPGAAQPDAERLAALHDARARAESGMLVVAVDAATGELIATVSLLRPLSSISRQSRAGEAEIRYLAVLPAYRRLGIGNALTRHAVEIARGWGVDAVVLDTGPQNAASQRLYSELGFQRIRARETTPAHGGGVLQVFRFAFVSTAGVDIRLIRPSEYDDVARSLLAAYTTAYAINDRLTTEILDVATRAREHEVWVAVDAGGTLLGSVVTPRIGGYLSPLARDGELAFRLLGVDPAAKGRGVGVRLVTHVLDLARTRGYERVVMNSGGQMTPAHALYRRLGFSVLEDRVRVEDNGHVSLAFGRDV